MTDKPTIPTDGKKKTDVSHPGMMGDRTEEQNLDECGNPAARIEKPKAKEVANHVAHFGRSGGLERLCCVVGRGAVEEVSRRLRFNLWLIV